MLSCINSSVREQEAVERHPGSSNREGGRAALASDPGRCPPTSLAALPARCTTCLLQRLPSCRLLRIHVLWLRHPFRLQLAASLRSCCSAARCSQASKQGGREGRLGCVNPRLSRPRVWPCSNTACSMAQADGCRAGDAMSSGLVSLPSIMGECKGPNPPSICVAALRRQGLHRPAEADHPHAGHPHRR